MGHSKARRNLAAAGKVSKRTDQRGIVTTYSYDGVYNMLQKLVDGKGVTDDANETFTYDGLGRMLMAKKDVNSTTISETEFAYNDIGKVAEANETYFADPNTTKTVEYTYDQAGYPDSIKYPTNYTVDITPDWQGRIDTVKWSFYFTVEYEYLGSRVAQRRHKRGLTKVASRQEYDNLGRITSIHAYKEPSTDIAKFGYEYGPNNNNISKMTYDHRTSDPCTDFSYDNLDRLTIAEYGIDDNNEVFTMDLLGNRTKVNVRDANDVNYAVANLTNRYTSVGDANLSYDQAGNLAVDKDGYGYQYDYENRIVKIAKDGNDIAEFAYDALGRRIEKKDLIDANNTRRYYYNNNWQVLCEYDGSGSFDRLFIYGNYIDEVLHMFIYDGYKHYWYVHDHLYSPVAFLTASMGLVEERYEYDAYGNFYILEPNFADDPDGKSDYANPYLFQGKRLDLLDDGGLELMSWPYRDYSTYLGRWLQAEKLGMIPNDAKQTNPFDPTKQYPQGMNTYWAFASNPISQIDSFGLEVCNIKEYHEPIRWIHWGLLVDSANIDAGPEPPPRLAFSRCPWGGPFYPTRFAKIWNLKRKTLGLLILPRPKLCCCASCSDIKKCIKKVCAIYDIGFFTPLRNCVTFVVDVKLVCCLKKGERVR